MLKIFAIVFSLAICCIIYLSFPVESLFMKYVKKLATIRNNFLKSTTQKRDL